MKSDWGSPQVKVIMVRLLTGRTAGAEGKDEYSLKISYNDSSTPFGEPYRSATDNIENSKAR